MINFFGWVGLGLIAYGFKTLFEKGDRELLTALGVMLPAVIICLIVMFIDIRNSKQDNNEKDNV